MTGVQCRNERDKLNWHDVPMISGTKTRMRAGVGRRHRTRSVTLLWQRQQRHQLEIKGSIVRGKKRWNWGGGERQLITNYYNSFLRPLFWTRRLQDAQLPGRTVSSSTLEPLYSCRFCSNCVSGFCFSSPSSSSRSASMSVSAVHGASHSTRHRNSIMASTSSRSFSRASGAKSSRASDKCTSLTPKQLVRVSVCRACGVGHVEKTWLRCYFTVEYSIENYC